VISHSKKSQKEKIMVLKLGSMLAIPLLVVSFSFAQAADKDKKPTAQQERMQKCNAEAKGMKGDERKKFMSGCLKSKAAAAAPDKGKALAKGEPEKGKSAEAPAKAKKGP
jgi:hypothetical protein